MNFSIGSRKENCFIEFKNIRKESGFDSESQKFLTVDVVVKVDGVNINSSVSYELIDFEGFTSDLEKMHRGIFKTFYFQQLDENFVLKFVATKNGIIDVFGKYSNVSYSVESNFKFEIDQSFLPNLQEQVNQVIQELSV